MKILVYDPRSFRYVGFAGAWCDSRSLAFDFPMISHAWSFCQENGLCDMDIILADNGGPPVVLQGPPAPYNTSSGTQWDGKETDRSLVAAS